jgi:hypothetical protein
MMKTWIVEGTIRRLAHVIPACLLLVTRQLATAQTGVYHAPPDTAFLITYNPHRLLSDAVNELAAAQNTDHVRLEQVLLAAPDVDRRPFAAQTLSRLRQQLGAQRVTIYSSSKDLALMASRFINGQARLGLSGESLVILPNLDTVDASLVHNSTRHTGGLNNQASKGLASDWGSQLPRAQGAR